MEECTKPDSTYLHLSVSIDNLECDCFVEGHLPYSLIAIIKPMFLRYKLRGSVEIWGTKFIKSHIGLTHKQWLYRNKDVHYISEGLTLRQHEELTVKVKVLMKMKCSALLGRHRHHMSTNFDELGRGPTLACQMLVANMEMAISATKVAKGRFCTHETLRQLRTPLALPPTQPSPPVTLSNVSIRSPLHHYQTPFTTPGSHARHPWLSKTPYSQPHTTPAHRPHLTTLPCSLSS